MPLVQNVSTRTPETMVGTLPELVASSTMPTTIIMMVGSNTASMSTTCARWSWRFARGNRTSQLCHVGALAHWILSASVADVVGHAVQVPDQADRGEGAEAVVGDIDFPPVEALARRGLVVMVVVVPALAEGEEGEREVVARVVVVLVAARAPEMGQRVDGERAVPAQHLGDAETPDEGFEAADDRRRRAERDRRQHPPAVEPAQLGIAREVLDAREVGVLEVAREEPAMVRPPEARLTDRVQVARRVGVLVVDAMMRGPPQRPLLRGERGADAEHKLKP